MKIPWWPEPYTVHSWFSFITTVSLTLLHDSHHVCLWSQQWDDEQLANLYSLYAKVSKVITCRGINCMDSYPGKLTMHALKTNYKHKYSYCWYANSRALTLCHDLIWEWIGSQWKGLDYKLCSTMRVDCSKVASKCHIRWVNLSTKLPDQESGKKMYLLFLIKTMLVLYIIYCIQVPLFEPEYNI